MAAAPQARPMMTIQESVRTCIRKYADFSGRATRAEFWWWVLATVIVGIAFSSIDTAIRSWVGWEFYSPFQSIYGLAVLLPDLAVTCRRLHDIGKSGWWQLVWVIIAILGVIPLVVGLILFFVGAFSEGFKNFRVDGSDIAALVVGIVISVLIWLAVAIWWLVWMARQGDTGPNRFGPDPRTLGDAETTAEEAAD